MLAEEQKTKQTKHTFCMQVVEILHFTETSEEPRATSRSPLQTQISRMCARLFQRTRGRGRFFRAQSTDSTLVQYGRGNNTCNSSVLDQTFLFLEVVRGQKNNEMMMMMMMENRRGRLAEITQNGKGKKPGSCVPRFPIQLPQRCSSVCLRSVAIKWRRL